jgi:hypothetical protein
MEVLIFNDRVQGICYWANCRFFRHQNRDGRSGRGTLTARFRRGAD